LTEKKGTILVVDDDTSILRTMSRILQKAGYSVDTGRCGKEALEKCTVNSYDAAIIDNGLGDMMGIDLLPQMQKVNPRMLRVMLTGTPAPESLLDTKLGADVFLLKPVSPETIIKTLDERLR
jgi:DNA-binding NtrC family response regulator